MDGSKHFAISYVYQIVSYLSSLWKNKLRHNLRQVINCSDLFTCLEFACFSLSTFYPHALFANFRTGGCVELREIGFILKNLLIDLISSPW